jgi:hypothetical protein
MTTKKSYIDLKLPSIMGMGAIGPTLSVITATLFAALCTATSEPPHWAYPAIMLVLSGLTAVFPVAKSTYPTWQKLCLWPITLAVVFSTAWGTNHTISACESVLAEKADEISWSGFSLVGSAYAGPAEDELAKATDKGAQVNKVDFPKVDFETKQPAFNRASLNKYPKHVWGLSWTNGPSKDIVILKDGKTGGWFQFTMRRKPDTGQQRQRQEPGFLKGGFFKRAK